MTTTAEPSNSSVTSSMADELLESALAGYRQRHGDYLQVQLSAIDTVSPRLLDAMRYAVLLGGKRVRPFLVYAVGNMLGAPSQLLDAPAAAIECIHAYSLVHDDLPAMDDDDLRRGKATCHRAFDEATAILAGDAIQTLAFELLSRPVQGLNARNQLTMVRILARAAGVQGMCAGQALDLAATNSPVSQLELEQIHQYKTSALIEAAVALAIEAANDYSVATEDKQQLASWAQTIGLAFQVQDDILDVVGDTKTLGKASGADAQLQKATYPGLMGLQGAQDYLQTLHQKALQALQSIPYNTDLLQAFTNYLITRDR